MLGIPPGVLPIRFLGVPLISSKLRQSDCQPLIHRITARVTSWTSRYLSYAGRVQLIKSVIFAIQSYWAAHFILPKSVLRAIQSIMCRFLWKGSSLLRYGSKVAGKDLFLPYADGGLAIKNLVFWNSALILPIYSESFLLPQLFYGQSGSKPQVFQRLISGTALLHRTAHGFGVRFLNCGPWR